jgi:hypothetical protein
MGADSPHHRHADVFVLSIAVSDQQSAISKKMLGVANALRISRRDKLTAEGFS